MNTAYIGIGTNVGDRLSNIKKALRLLSKHISICAVSSVYETEPVGYLAQPDFLNCVVAVDTDLTPLELLKILKDIEGKLGRKNTFTNGPRIIDLDILIFGDVEVSEVNLKIPHPRLHERAFALIPLLEIVPDLVYPGTSSKISGLINKQQPSGRIHKLDGCVIRLDRRRNVPYIG